MELFAPLVELIIQTKSTVQCISHKIFKKPGMSFFKLLRHHAQFKQSTNQTDLSEAL
ncbi:Uncharacterised protein [Shigella flexneri]|nr:Uncharacterised protein [Shigella flexneri]